MGYSGDNVGKGYDCLCKFFFGCKEALTLKKGGGLRETRERVEPYFFVTFNIIIRHIFPENVIEIPRVI